MGEEYAGDGFLTHSRVINTIRARRRELHYRVRFEPLNQNTVEERHDSLDGFESYLGSLRFVFGVVS